MKNKNNIKTDIKEENPLLMFHFSNLLLNGTITMARRIARDRGARNDSAITNPLKRK